MRQGMVLNYFSISQSLPPPTPTHTPHIFTVVSTGAPRGDGNVDSVSAVACLTGCKVEDPHGAVPTAGQPAAG